MTLTVAPPNRNFADVTDALADRAELTLLTSDGKRVELPTELRMVLAAAVQFLSEGQDVLLVGKDSYLSTQEAAEYLGVSRPTMIRILDLGHVPYDRPNSHRRIKLADLAEYKAERQKRRAALDELLDMSDEMDQYDGGFVRTR